MINIYKVRRDVLKVTNGHLIFIKVLEFYVIIDAITPEMELSSCQKFCHRHCHNDSRQDSKDPAFTDAQNLLILHMAKVLFWFNGYKRQHSFQLI